jgi:MFS family permease
MDESPVLQRQNQRKTSTNPLKEFWKSLQFKICFCFIWSYNGTRGSLVHGQFYAMSFMKTVTIRLVSGRILLGTLLMGTPFFIVFGWLSDKIGRKYIMMGGLLLAYYCTDLFTNKCMKRQM